MKHLSLSIIALLVVIPNFSLAQVGRAVVTRGQAVSEGHAYGKFFRMSFRSTQIFQDASKSKKLEYIKTYIWEAGEYKIYEDNDLSKDKSADFDISFVKNPILASNFGNVFVKVRPNKSIKPFKGSLVLYATPYQFTTLYKSSPNSPPVLAAPLVPNKNAFEVVMRGQWVTKTNWRSIAYHIFGIIKIIFDLTMIAVIIGKPMLPEYAKIHASWIGQTVIWWQYFMYTGLTTGLFGGLINEVQDGILEASREFFFMKLTPDLSSDYIGDVFGFIIYKYFDNNIAPSLTKEMFVQIFLLAIIALVSWIIELFSKNQKLIKTVREVRSSIAIFVMAPIMTFALYIFYTYALVGNFGSFLIVLNCILAVFALTYFVAFALSRMSITVSSINYLHSRGVYQEGKVEIEQCCDWAFDSYISMDTKVWLRIFEFMMLGSIATAFTLTYEWKAAGPIFICFVWIVMTLIQIQKIRKFESGTPERELTLKIIKLNIVFTILMFVQHLIMVCLYIFTTLSLSSVKIFVIVYMITITLIALALLTQLAMRIKSIFIVPDHIKDRKEKLSRRNDETYQQVNRQVDEEEEQSQKKIQGTEAAEKINSPPPGKKE